jgi:methionine synthase I (cobalamin-dependent)
MSSIIQPMAASSENALRLHDIAETLARDIRQAGARIPREAAARLTQNVRAVVAQAMVGRVPHAATLSLFLVMLTNIVADLLAEIERAGTANDDATGARVRALEQVFSELLRNCVSARVVAALAPKLAAPEGTS